VHLSGDNGSSIEAAPVRVVIADDDPLARGVIGAMIGADPSVELVGEAEGVNDVVDLVVRERPEVAVLDWMMPGGGGPQAAIQIGLKAPETRIVGLTSSTSPAASMAMMRAGARSFLVKGGSAAQLVRAIHQALDY
jgi:DNA-binding NarL/FixJ family response regulator